MYIIADMRVLFLRHWSNM